ncbi:MAG: CgeB family protein [Segniliparus sp.]|uniref:CgeB family protein n=1 Tax=Segniliparus sp. TaxID=2804064 RepID=UPI003F303829
MKILFAGDDWYGSNARSLADGFRLAGHDIAVVDTTPVTLPRRGTPSWCYAKATGRRDPRSVREAHEQLAAAAAALRPDLLFAYKSIHLDQERLLSLPVPLKAHYSADDVSNPDNTTPEYLAAEPRWDVIVTTKAHNVGELRARGAREVVFVLSAYDPAWHRPVARRGGGEYLAGFVGALRPDRAGLLRRLAARYRGRFYLAGPGWQRDLASRTSGARVAGAQYGEDLSRAISSILANLVLLNSDNRDTHTCRTFEVPAAGGLFVGQRTVEHADLFDDGTEAFLFDGEEELVDIVERIAADPELAKAVAGRGRRAIVEGGHSYQDRAEAIIDRLR